MAVVTVQDNWIKVQDKKFTCGECENTDVILTNTIDGMVEADLDKIKAELKEFPTKIIYGICSICGMEYTFKLVEEELYLEPSNEEK